MKRNYNYHLALKIFFVVFALLIDSIFIFLVKEGVYPQEKLIGGLIVCILFSLLLTSFFFSWLESYDEYIIFVFYGLRFNQKIYYNNINSIYNYIFGMSSLELISDKGTKIKLLAPIHNKLDFYHQIIAKNPECRVSPAIARRLKKKYGQKYYNTLNVV